MGDILGFLLFIALMCIMAFCLITFVKFLAGMVEKRELQRRKEIKDYCLANNIEYNEKSSRFPTLIKNFNFTYLKEGKSHSWILETFGRIDDIMFYLVEHRYRLGPDSSKPPCHDTICLLKKQNLNLPDFFVRDEVAGLDTIAKAFGGQDINFIDDSVFSKKFVLQGKNENAIRDYFNKSVRQAFVECHKSGYCSYLYEGKGDSFLVYKGCFLDNKGRIEMLNYAVNLFKKII